MDRVAFGPVWLLIPPTPNVQLRAQMDSTGLSDERAARSVATRTASGPRDRSTRRPRRSSSRSEPARGSQGSSTPSLTINVPAADATFSMSAVGTADHRQAEYFLGLLAQSRRLSEHRIDQYRKAIAVCETNGDVEGSANYRHLICGEEQDRQMLDGLIEKLHGRFAPGAESGRRRLPAARVK